jgi:preprotein translocase subunit SecA
VIGGVMVHPVVRRARLLLPVIERHAADLVGRSDADLAAVVRALRRRVSGRETLGSVLPELFAAVCEAYRRVVGGLPHEVLVVAGVAMQRGAVTRLPLGADAAVASLFPTALFALAGTGVHVVSGPSASPAEVTGRLAPVFDRLGLSVGVLAEPYALEARRVAYAADATYGAHDQFGYDYLRDNLAWGPDEVVQRGQHFAVVQETDIVLLREARPLLLITGPDEAADARYNVIAQLAPMFEAAVERSTPGRGRQLTAAERARMAELVGPDGPSDQLMQDLARALQARERYRAGEHYVVRDGQLRAADRVTGGPSDRRYPTGIQQALEAKEGLPLSPARVDLARTTPRALFGRYGHLCGTYTDPDADAVRLQRLYHLPVADAATGALPAATNADSDEHQDRWIEFDQVLDEQQDRIYAIRRAVLTGSGRPFDTRRLLDTATDNIVTRYCLPTAAPDSCDLDGLSASLKELYGDRIRIRISAADVADSAALATRCRDEAHRCYQDRVNELGLDAFAELEQMVGIAVIDRVWRDHLAKMDNLQDLVDGTDRLSYLANYRLAATNEFRAMQEKLEHDVVRFVMNLEVEVRQEDDPPTPSLEEPHYPAHSQLSPRVRHSATPTPKRKRVRWPWQKRGYP